MRSRCGVLGTALLVTVASIVIILGTPPVHAANSAQTIAPLRVTRFSQTDLNGDGKPDRATLWCSCVTDQDIIVVVDNGNDMNRASTWRQGTDTENDWWVFDIGGDGRVELIIQFLNQNGASIARLYDDGNGDGSVAYHLDGASVFLDESPYWTMQFTTEGGWQDDEQMPNQTVQILMDGPVAYEGFSSGFEFLHQEWADRYMPHDGVPDVEWRLVDKAGDGVPDYLLSLLLADIPSSLRVGHSRLYVNRMKEPVASSSTAPFWPFLDLRKRSKDPGQRFLQVLPTIKMDWEHAQLGGIQMIGYPTEEGYWINSIAPIELQRSSRVNYEAPHAWYDLAADRDGIPELNIRLLDVVTGAPPEPWQEIRYSWNQFQPNTMAWDFKIGLMGKKTIEQTVQFDAFDIAMVPFQELPVWVTEQAWDITTFVANELDGYGSAEGIYAWSPWSGADPVSAENPGIEAHNAAIAYLTGASVSPPSQFFQEIWIGHRGEYNFDGPAAPWLYVSPIDQRLHLKGADFGLFNPGDEKQVTYGDKDQDGYVDYWRLSQSLSTPEQQLYIAGGHAIYSGKNDVFLIEHRAEPSVFELLPPRTYEEWLAIGQKVPPSAGLISLANLQAMAMQLGPVAWRMTNAYMQDVRATEDGYRTVLEVRAGFQLNCKNGCRDILALQTLSPGTYLLEYNGSFHVTPLTPPVLSLSLQIAEQDAWPYDVHPPLRIKASNTGLEDASNLQMVGEVVSPGKTSEFTRRPLTLLSGDVVDFTVDFPLVEPLLADDARLRISVVNSSEQVIATTTLNGALLGQQAANPIHEQDGVPVHTALTLLGAAIVLALAVLLGGAGCFVVLTNLSGKD